MIKRAGGQIINGQRFYWTNFYIDQLKYDYPFYLIPCYTVPDEWLPEMFDNNCSAFLMPMPRENWN